MTDRKDRELCPPVFPSRIHGTGLYACIAAFDLKHSLYRGGFDFMNDHR